jgi:hypothetical protein
MNAFCLLLQPSLQSSVIATPQDEQRREVAIQSQNKDEKSKARFAI